MRARWRAAAGWAALIEVLVLWPSPPEIPQGWAIAWLDFIKLDKVAHGGLFAVLSVLLVRALVVDAKPWWLAFVLAAAFGAFTEVQQHFIPSRSMEFGDFLADAGGAALGLAAFVALARKRRELSR